MTAQSHSCGMRMRLCPFTFGTWLAKIIIHWSGFLLLFQGKCSKLSDPRGWLLKKFLSTAILFPNCKVKLVHVLINMFFFCTHTPSLQCSTGSTSCHLTQQPLTINNNRAWLINMVHAVAANGCGQPEFSIYEIYFSKISKWPMHENFVPSKFGTMW